MYLVFPPRSPASFFHMRYKSLTNLHNAHLNPNGGGEYDTLESSNSGGKTSGGGDSGGSRTLPEKRRRGGGTISRPASVNCEAAFSELISSFSLSSRSTLVWDRYISMVHLLGTRFN